MAWSRPRIRPVSSRSRLRASVGVSSRTPSERWGMIKNTLYRRTGDDRRRSALVVEQPHLAEHASCRRRLPAYDLLATLTCASPSSMTKAAGGHLALAAHLPGSRGTALVGDARQACQLLGRAERRQQRHLTRRHSSNGPLSHMSHASLTAIYPGEQPAPSGEPPMTAITRAATSVTHSPLVVAHSRGRKRGRGAWGVGRARCAAGRGEPSLGPEPAQRPAGRLAVAPTQAARSSWPSTKCATLSAAAAGALTNRSARSTRMTRHPVAGVPVDGPAGSASRNLSREGWQERSP